MSDTAQTSLLNPDYIARNPEVLEQFLQDCITVTETERFRSSPGVLRSRIRSLVAVVRETLRPTIRGRFYNERPGVITIDDIPRTSEDNCECEFAPYDDEDKDEESCHFLRRCLLCRHTFYSLHCVHEGAAEFRCVNCNDK